MKSAAEAEAAIKELEYPSGEMTRDERVAKHEEYRAGVARINLEFRAYVEHVYATSSLSRSVRDALWQKAWDDGHSNGLREVELHYEDIVDIVRLAIKESR